MTMRDFTNGGVVRSRGRIEDIKRAVWRQDGFPDSSVCKESACSAGDPGLIPGSGRSAGEGIGYPPQYSWASLVAQLGKNLLTMWETWVRSWVGKIPWRRERLPIPVFWPGEFHGLYSPWDRKESDRTEQLSLSLTRKKDLYRCE